MITKVSEDKRWIAALLFCLFLIYLGYISERVSSGTDFIKGDSHYYRAVIISILEDGDLLLDNNINADPLNGQLAIGQIGFVPKHPILMPLLSIPFYYAFGNIGLLLFNVLFCALLITLIFMINVQFTDAKFAFITALLYASSTLFLNYIYNYSSDIVSTVILLGGLYLVFRERFYSGTFLLGLSVFAKVTNVPLVGIIFLYIILVIVNKRHLGHEIPERPLYRKMTTLLIVSAIFLLSLLPFAYTNYMLFGSPFVTGYQQTAIVENIQNQVVLSDHTNMFNQPLFKGSLFLLFHPQKGVIPTNPIILLSVLGVIYSRKKDFNKEKILILALCLIQFIIFAKYDAWFTSHFSNRFLMTSIALSSVFTGFILKRIFERLFSETTQ